MIVALCGASLALQPGTQPLLLLRGGAQPAVVQAPAMDPAAMDPAPKVRLTEVRNKARPRRSKKKQKGPGAFGLRDGAAALVGVAAVGATFVSTDRIMMSLPRELHSVGWTALGGVLLSGLYALLALIYYDRALQWSAPLCKLVYGGGPSPAISSILLFVLGSVASANTLPQLAG